MDNDEKMLFSFLLGMLYGQEPTEVFGSIVLKGWAKKYLDCVEDKKYQPHYVLFYIVSPLNKLCEKYKIRKINNNPDHIEIFFCSFEEFSSDNSPHFYIQKKDDL